MAWEALRAGAAASEAAKEMAMVGASVGLAGGTVEVARSLPLAQVDMAAAAAATAMVARVEEASAAAKRAAMMGQVGWVVVRMEAGSAAGLAVARVAAGREHRRPREPWWPGQRRPLGRRRRPRLPM